MLVSALFVTVDALADNDFYLYGRVKESLGKNDLTNAYVLLYDDDGNITDSIQANQGRKWSQFNGLVEISSFSIPVPRVDSVYVFDVVCDKYQTKTITFSVKNIGKRETGREMPVIFLERAPHKLGEVTVTTSKIKFYNKGDTVVYNADAFQLAEGSMLDALISQLPGVELTADGQIKVNGEFVESLLLNGKDFFDGNKNLMLENIGAYTVKDIQVFKGDSKAVRQGMALNAPKVLTMDVRLKREFIGGTIVNGQAGYGSSDRYLGRLFASRYTGTTNVSVFGNINNLNDSRTPGRNDTWTPDQMPTGRREFVSGGINYSYDSADEKTSSGGNIAVSSTKNNASTTVGQTNFLPGGNTYDNAFSDGRSRDFSANLYHFLRHQFAPFSISNNISGMYRNNSNASSNLSGTFNREYSDMTMSMLDAIYSDASTEQLGSLINLSKTRRDSKLKTIQGDINQSFTYNMPKSEDAVMVRFGASYASTKNNVWDDYDIRYGVADENRTRRRQYTDNSPNHNLNLYGTLSYGGRLKKVSYNIDYTYSFTDQVLDSYMFALERLEDMGIYGELPDNYYESFVPEWSNTSRTMTNTHSLTPWVSYFNTINGNMLFMHLYSRLSFTHRHFNYQRAGCEYPLSVSNFSLYLPKTYGVVVDYRFDGEGEEQQRKYRHSIEYYFGVSPRLPELVDMIDIVNDADPLNVYLGNPDLKLENAFSHRLRWSLTPHSKPISNIITAEFTHRSNALTRGYSYDTETGVRTNRTYNTSGNWDASLRNDLKWQFGGTKQFTLTSGTHGNAARYSDMIGADSEPELTHVNFKSISQKISFVWLVGGQTLTLRADYTHRNTSSTQAGFNTLDADILNYGLSGVFKLPAGFGLSTDFMCYSRHGYGISQLDTTDPVWNARVTYTPKRYAKWTFTLDAFDMLHTLTNVHYAISATGRTVTFTNTLPRYVLFSVQFRFSKQPKK